MGHDVGMPFDFTHLAQAIRHGRGELGLSQAAFAERAGVSEKTIKNLEQANYVRWPQAETLAAVEKALGKPEGWARQVATSDPTPRRETPREPQSPNMETSTDTRASATSRLPVPVQLALEVGELLDYEVATFEVDGEPVTMVALVRTRVEGDEHKKDVLRRQLEEFGKIKGVIRRLADETAEPPDDPSNA